MPEPVAVPPTIEAERLRLVPFSDAHLSARYVGWLNDPVVVRYSKQRLRTHTLESCRDFCDKLRAAGHPFWAVERSGDGLHIGNLVAYIDRGEAVANLAILMGERTAWGEGYGTEAWVAACRWLLGPGAMRKVEAGTMAVNAAMRAIMRKSGMHDDGRRIRHVMWEGQEVDQVHAALFREDIDNGGESQ